MHDLGPRIDEAVSPSTAARSIRTPRPRSSSPPSALQGPSAGEESRRAAKPPREGEGRRGELAPEPERESRQDARETAEFSETSTRPYGWLDSDHRRSPVTTEPLRPLAPLRLLSRARRTSDHAVARFRPPSLLAASRLGGSRPIGLAAWASRGPSWPLLGGRARQRRAGRGAALRPTRSASKALGHTSFTPHAAHSGFRA